MSVIRSVVPLADAGESSAALGAGAGGPGTTAQQPAQRGVLIETRRGRSTGVH
ncbi:hypothetical protein ACFWV1_14605 [Streptomyces sp. NPDC058700]|uniref:hypothetical protein n=1 Tax=unclassified Streptomyces TaxID=2593676 RepID=UPI00364686A4